MNSAGVLYAYLLGVDANQVVFATNSLYVHDGSRPETEFRIASPMQREALDKTLDAVDRNADRIDSWRAVYAWLGRDVRPGGITGWTTFDESFAVSELSHWFGEDSPVECVRPNQYEAQGIEAAFRAATLPVNWVSQFREPLKMMLGDVDDGEEVSDVARCLSQMVSNMLVSHQPIHVAQ